jgi:hypothetical protein
MWDILFKAALHLFVGSCKLLSQNIPKLNSFACAKLGQQPHPISMEQHIRCEMSGNRGAYLQQERLVFLHDGIMLQEGCTPCEQLLLDAAENGHYAACCQVI